MTATTTAPSEALILTGDGYGLSIAPDAEAAKAELIQAASSIITVASAAESDAARDQVKRLASMRNLVEKSRKAVKEPVLKVGKQIDAKAAEFLAAITTEETRLTGLIGSYAQEQERIRRDEMARAEAARRETERLEQERARVERERLAAEEKARKEAEGKTGIDALQAEAALEEERERKAEEARKIEEQAKAAREQQNASFAAVTAPAPAGVTMVPDFEVTDIKSLYQNFPELVDLTPRRADILARIKGFATSYGKLPDVPGLRVFEKPKVFTR